MNYIDTANGLILGIVVVLILVVIILQTIIMIKKGWKEANRLGVDDTTIKLVVKNSISISIIPTVSIVIILFLLVPLLGTYLPLLRLSVIGSAAFEMIAAELGAQSAGASGLVTEGFTSEAFVNAAWCMSIGGSCSLLVSALVLKPVFKVYDKIRDTDTTWMKLIGGIAMTAVIVSLGIDKIAGGVLATIIVLASVAFTIVCQYLAKKYDKKVLNDFIMPVTIIFGLVLSFVLGNYII